MPRHGNFWQQLRESLPGIGCSAPLELSFQHRPFATCLQFMSETCRVITKCEKAFQKRADPPTPPPPSINTPCCCFHAHLLAVGCLRAPLSDTPHFAFIPTSSRAGTVRAVCSDSPSPRRLSSCVRHAERHVRVRRGPRVARQDC